MNPYVRKRIHHADSSEFAEADFYMCVFPYMSRLMKNQRNDMCAKRRLRSAWASAQSDQSLRCLHEESLGRELPILLVLS